MTLQGPRGLALGVVVCLGLASCGQRGPLTLPEEVDTTGTPAAGDEIATEESPSDEADSDEG